MVSCHGLYGQLLQSLRSAATVSTVSTVSCYGVYGLHGQVLQLIKSGLDHGGFIYVVSISQGQQDHGEQESCAIAKMTARCALYMSALKVSVHRKFEMHSLSHS